jgi:hypothetical protein
MTDSAKPRRCSAALNGNFAPDHVRFPRLLQRLGKNDHFELITPYSHRYAPEFIEPHSLSDERLPWQPDGTPFDPFTLTHIEGSEISHLYFPPSARDIGAERDRVAKVLRTAGPFLCWNWRDPGNGAVRPKVPSKTEAKAAGGPGGSCCAERVSEDTKGERSELTSKSACAAQQVLDTQESG